jgi:hypothetical protein
VRWAAIARSLRTNAIPPPQHHQMGASDDHRRMASVPSGDCRLGAVCDGPMAALFALMSAHGILPEATSALPPRRPADAAGRSRKRDSALRTS